MALDQSALLEVLEVFKAAEVDDKIRQAAETIDQALIEAELASVIRGRLVVPKLRVSWARRVGSLSDGTRIVAASPALPMSMPHTRSRYSGSSVTSSTRPHLCLHQVRETKDRG
jgi:hypothetical protein